MKLALVGAGGFRTPGMYSALADAAEELPVSELVLHDVDAQRLARIEIVLRAIEDERGAGIPFRAALDLDDALEGADIVFCSIRVGGLAARLVDETIPLELGLLGQETVGAGGISYALRTLPAALEIAERVAARAPSAWFLNYTNPAGLVTEAVQEILGPRAVGICDAPPTLFSGVAEALGRDPTVLDFDYGGLNHLGWLKAVREGGRDLLPELLADDDRLATFNEGRIFGGDLLRRLGRIPNEYLAYYYFERDIVAAILAAAPRAALLLEHEASFYGAGNGSPAEALAVWRSALRRRSSTYMAEVDGAAGDEADLPEDGGLGGYTAVALGVVRALVTGQAAVLVLNTANRATLPFLDEHAVVEVPCVVDAAGIRPLPSSAWTPDEEHLISIVKECERATIAAAATGSREHAARALALNPLVPSEQAVRLLERYRAELPELRRVVP